MERTRILFVCRDGVESGMLARELKEHVAKIGREKEFDIDHLPNGMDGNHDLLEVKAHLNASHFVVLLPRGPSLANDISRYSTGKPVRRYTMGPNESNTPISEWGEKILAKAKVKT